MIFGLFYRFFYFLLRYIWRPPLVAQITLRSLRRKTLTDAVKIFSSFVFLGLIVNDEPYD